MKIQRMAACMSVVLMAVPLAGADGLLSRLEWERPLEGVFVAGQRGRLVVAGDVFGESRDFPNDLRMYGSDGTQWPWFLHVPMEEAQTVSIGLGLLNQAWVDGPEPFLQFDVSIPEVDGKRPVHNRLELETSGGDLVRRVEIFVGDEVAGHMASGYLIDFPNRRDASNRVIQYPDSDAARLHVRIYPNARAADERFDIIRASLQHRVEKTVEREAVAFSLLPVESRDQVEEAQSWILDLGHAGRPAEFLGFDVEGGNTFVRCVSVYGRNTARDPWRWVGGGGIHSLANDRNDTVRINAQFRYLHVQVFHYDDPPLDIAALRLEAVPRQLVFEAASDGAAAMYFRGWDVPVPRYDLQERIGLADLDALPVVGTLETRPNAVAKAQPWRKYSKALSGLAVGVVSLIVVWVIVGMLRQQPPAETE